MQKVPKSTMACPTLFFLKFTQVRRSLKTYATPFIPIAKWLENGSLAVAASPALQNLATAQAVPTFCLLVATTPAVCLFSPTTSLRV